MKDRLYWVPEQGGRGSVLENENYLILHSLSEFSRLPIKNIKSHQMNIN